MEDNNKDEETKDHQNQSKSGKIITLSVIWSFKHT